MPIPTFFKRACCSLLLFFSVPTNAQQKFSIELTSGVGFHSNIINVLNQMPVQPGYLGSVSVNNRPVFVQLLGAYAYNDKWTFKAGVNYMSRDFSVNQLSQFGGLSSNNVLSIESFSVPLQVNYSVLKNKTTALYVFGGVAPRLNSRGIQTIAGNSSKEPDELKTIREGNNLFLNGQSYEGIFTNADSGVTVSTNYYQYSRIDLFTYVGVGGTVTLTKKLGIQLNAQYNFQLNKSNIFGQYGYSENYRNGTLVGVFKEHNKSEKFRDNFFSIHAGLVYRL